MELESTWIIIMCVSNAPILIVPAVCQFVCVCEYVFLKLIMQKTCSSYIQEPLFMRVLLHPNEKRKLG